MAAPQPVNVPARGLIVKTQDVEKMAELGRGQFGVVLAGALKIAAKTYYLLLEPDLYGISPGDAVYNRFLCEFFAEASKLASLLHVNVIRVYGVAYDDAGVPWMLLERGDMSLDSFLSRNKAASGITEEEFVVMWFQVACGCLYLHGHKPLPIIHRDIKPDNVMIVISPTDGVVTYKLGDVGLARMTNPTGRRAEEYAGAARYRAPEVTTGAGFTGTADVYSLGCLVAELGMKYLNVPGKTRRSVLTIDSDWENDIPNGIAWLAHVSPRLSALLASCCDENPVSRMTSARLVDSLLELYPALLTPLLPPPDDLTVAFTNLEEQLAAERAAPAVLEELKAANTQISTLQAQVAELRAQAQQKDVEHHCVETAMATEIDSLTEARRILAEELANQKQLLTVSTDKERRLSDLLSGALLEDRKKAEQLATAEADLAAARAELQQVHQDLKTEKLESAKQRQFLEEKFRGEEVERERALAVLESELRAATARVRTAEAEAASLTQKLNASEEILSGVRLQLADTESQLSACQSSLAQSEQTVSTLRKQLLDTESKSKLFEEQLVARQAQLQAAYVSMKDFEGEVAKLQDARAELQQVHQDLKTEKLESAKQRQFLEEKFRGEEVEREGALAVLESELRAATARVRTAEAEAASLIQKLNASEEIISGVRLQLADTESQLSACQSSLAQSEQTVSTLRKQLLDTESKSKLFEEQLVACQAQLQAAYEDLEGEVAKLQDARAELQQVQQQLFQQLNASEQAISAAEQKDFLLREVTALTTCPIADLTVVEVKGTGQNGMVVSASVAKPGFPFPPPYKLALKVVFNYGLTTGGASNAFVNEYAVLATLARHPNINAYLGQRVESIPDAIMEVLPPVPRDEATYMVNGEVKRRKAQFVLLRHHDVTLKQYMEENGPLPFHRFASLARGLLSAEVHLFEQLHVHLDVKPDNVLVDCADPDRPTLILCDFGCARKVPASWMLRTEPLQGNQSYRAPEVLNTVSLYRANPGTSAWEWMDLSKQGSFECGVLLYWMATQRDALPNYPASYGSPGNIRYSVSRIAWSAMPAAYPPGVQAIVQGLMEFDHTRRMSVADAKAALLALPESLDAAAAACGSSAARVLSEPL